MTESSPQERLEFLTAGRVFGDLSEKEESEWAGLIAELGEQADPSLDELAAILDIGFSAKTALPIGLAERLKRELLPTSSERGELISLVTPSTTVHAPEVRRSFFQNSLGWALAACFGVMLVVQAWDNAGKEAKASAKPDGTAPFTDPTGIELEFQGIGDFANVQGKLVWSDQLQDGVMKLKNLPQNDPSQAQYQLWIVDPDRSAQPVDGGVFDFAASGDEFVEIPIDAKLRVDRPVAFVITLEKPGGVVVSEQKIVVASANS